MTELQIKKMMAELTKAAWGPLLEQTAREAVAQCSAKSPRTYYIVKIQPRWEAFRTEEACLGADELMAWITERLATHKQRFGLRAIHIQPVAEYTDDEGSRQEYKGYDHTYWSQVYDREWKEVRWRIASSDKQYDRRGRLSRLNMAPGWTFLNEDECPLGKVVVAGQDYWGVRLSLADGSQTGVFSWNTLEKTVALLTDGNLELRAKLDLSEYPGAELSDNRMTSEPLPANGYIDVSLYDAGLTISDVKSGAHQPLKTVRVTVNERMKDIEGFDDWQMPLIAGYAEGCFVVGYKDGGYSTSTFSLDKLSGMLGLDETIYIEVERKACSGTAVAALHWPKDVKAEMEIRGGVLLTVPDVEEISVPEGVTRIDKQALLMAPSLRRLHLPRACYHVNWAVSSFCYEHAAYNKLCVTYGGTLQEWLANGEKLAEYVKSLEIEGRDIYHIARLELPEGITRLAPEIFSGCEAIEHLVLPVSLTDIGSRAFCDCEHLETVRVLGPAVIGNAAFCSCGSLRNVYLADGVREIGAGAFSFVTKMERLFIPKSVERVGGALSEQNDAGYYPPTFDCEARERPEDWNEHFHLMHTDYRFPRKYYHHVC